MSGEPIYFAILGHYPFNELGYDPNIKTVQDATDNDRLEF